MLLGKELENNLPTKIMKKTLTLLKVYDYRFDKK